MSNLSKFLTKIKRNLTKTVAIVALAISVVAPIADTNQSAIGNSSSNPRFNFLPGDLEMLTAANYTKGQSDWSDPVTGSYAADAGDEIVFRFYFHNGRLNTTATNTTFRAEIPNNISTQHRIFSSLWSDQTPAIIDTMVDNKLVGYGYGFAEINLNIPAKLEYIPGSTKLWRKTPNQWGVSLPDGITTDKGLNIGNVCGCWEYSGYITFKARVKSPAQIEIDKFVSKSGSNDSWNTVLEGVKEGDEISWKIPVRNTGDMEAVNVLVKDTLPAGLSYIKGSTIYYGPEAPVAGNKVPDGISGNGIYIDTLKPGSSNDVYFVFKTKVVTGLSYGSAGTSELINYVKAVYNNHTVQDQAKVIVTGESGLAIQKKVWDGKSWVEQNQIKLGDEITYQITVSNSGQTSLENVTVSDIIPLYSQYINNSTKLNGASVADGIESNGISIGKINRGGKAVIEFSVKTYGCPPVGDYTLTNTAYASASNVQSVSDTASTIMSLIKIIGPSVLNL